MTSLSTGDRISPCQSGEDPEGEKPQARDVSRVLQKASHCQECTFMIFCSYCPGELFFAMSGAEKKDGAGKLSLSGIRNKFKKKPKAKPTGERGAGTQTKLF